jgi:hypothetical protein
MLPLLLALAFHPSVDVPPIGHIFGLRVGVDTIEQLEHRLGPGFKYTGGHPRGGRAWRDPRTHWEISADGFEYQFGGGRLLESMSLDWDAWEEKLPRAKKATYGVYAKIKPGMSRDQVHGALKGLQGTWSKDDFMQRGYADVHHATNSYVVHLRAWGATFSYGEQGLERVTFIAK